MVFNGWAAGPETWALTTFPRDWTFDYLEQLEGLPEKVIEDFDEVVLVGFSMGSTTALRLLLKYPEKVKGLVLVSATPRMMEERVDGVKVWEGFSPRRLAAFEFGTEMVFGGDPSPLYETGNLKRGLKYLEDTDLRAALEQRYPAEAGSLPVYIFHSERDGIVRPHNAAYFKRLFPEAKVTIVPGNEHTLPVTIPALLDEAVSILVR